MAKRKSDADAEETTPGFEQSLEDLEAIVRRLEHGGGSLDEALDEYARAIGLLKSCHQRLEEAQRKVEMLSGVDAEGNPKFTGFGGFDGAGPRGGRTAGAGGFNAEDILKEFMSGFAAGGGRRASGNPFEGTSAGGGAGWDPFSASGAGAQGSRTPRGKGADININLTVTLEDANAGKSIPVALPTGKTVSVKLPIPLEEGQQIRLRGQGQPSPIGGPAGDALVTVKFARHKHFRRDGNDLRVDVPITLYEAVLGAKVRVPTLSGNVELNLPAGPDTSKALRLKGKGLFGKGDLYVNLRVVLPDGGDPDLESLMRFWRDQKPYKVRD